MGKQLATVGLPGIVPCHGAAVFALLSLVACSRIGASEPATTDNQETDADCDADTDSDSDGDADTDTDTDTEPDTGSECGTDCYELAWIEIPGGVFMMGSNEGEPGEKPVHEVTVPSFEMTRTEVTVAQYRDCVENAACSEPDAQGVCAPDQYGNWNAAGHENDPVNCVTWKQARAFCMTNDGRLPTEAEWEFAARSRGLDVVYPWGDAPATCARAVMNDGGDGCGTNRTLPVCSKMAGNTEQGLCDMAGNVWEWVQDCYNGDYASAPVDGSSEESCFQTVNKVIRGGSFGSMGQVLRTTQRTFEDEDAIRSYLGFRCVK